MQHQQHSRLESHRNRSSLLVPIDTACRIQLKDRKGGLTLLRLLTRAKRSGLGVLCPLFFFGLTSLASASDGVIEINQARALAGGVTAGDTPGFPVSISESASYRLVGGLDVAATGVNAISVSVNDVSIDLNGFSITGPGSGSGQGISASGRTNITVIDGTVRDMGGNGISLGQNARVEGVKSLSNGGIGISTFGDSTIRNNISAGNGSNGFAIGSHSTITGNTSNNNTGPGISGANGVISGNTVNNNSSAGILDNNGNSSPSSSVISGNSVFSNGSVGISAKRGSTVSGNSVSDNSGDGISTNPGCRVVGNTVHNNTGLGLNLQGGAPLNPGENAGPSGYADNVIDNNNGGNANAQVSGGVEMGTNVCGGDTTCP